MWLIEPTWYFSEARNEIGIFRFLKRRGDLKFFFRINWPSEEVV